MTSSDWTGAVLPALLPGISYFCIIVNGMILLLLENSFGGSPIINSNARFEAPAV